VGWYEQLSREDLLDLLGQRDRLIAGQARAIGELRATVERLERIMSRNSGFSELGLRLELL
jgi:hypothetical protein